MNSRRLRRLLLVSEYVQATNHADLTPAKIRTGKPFDWRIKPKPIVHVQPNRLSLILPSVVGTHPVSQLGIMKSIPRIKSDRYVNLIRACRSYQDALWIAESEPNLAWLMFVSALETAANDVYTTDASPDERLRDAKPDLAELLEKHGGDELVHKVAESIAHTLGATKKFIDFTMQFMPDKPDQRPEHEFRQVKWSNSGLKNILNKVYEYRSRALHDGIPFPRPNAWSPILRFPRFARIRSTTYRSCFTFARWNMDAERCPH